MKRTTEIALPQQADGKIDYKAVFALARKKLNDSDFFETMFGAMPYDGAIEQAVLGACLMDFRVYNKVRAICKVKEPFYKEEHNLIWAAFEDLAQKGNPIDTITVAELLQRKKEIEKVGGAGYLIDLTRRIASTANVEYHACILFDKYVQRKMIHIFQSGLKKVTSGTESPFELIDNHISELKSFSNPTPLIMYEDIGFSNERSLSVTPQKRIIGDFLKVKDTAVLFAEQKNGKSILAYQIADAISKGKSLFGGLLPNECEPMKVLYYDFELEDHDIRERYSNEGQRPYFSSNNENFIRAYINPKSMELDKIPLMIQQEIENAINNRHKPEVIIIDNITYLTADSSQDATVAMRLMRFLQQMKIKNGITILILAHTPKRDKTKPITKNDLAGSSQIMNFITSLFTIGMSNTEKGVRYIKHLLTRTGQIAFDEDNVILCNIKKPDNFLHFEHTGELAREADHLAIFEQIADKKDVVAEGFEMRKQGNSWNAIHKVCTRNGYKKTVKTLQRDIEFHAATLGLESILEDIDQNEFEAANRSTDGMPF